MDMTLLIALLLLLGDSRNPGRTGAAAASSHTRPASATTPALPDPELERIIREKLARSKMASDKFTVRVHSGAATLEGRTDVIQRKGAATRIARTAGAREVINKIQVSDAARARASANLAKGRRRAQVKRGESRSESVSRLP